MSFLLFVSIMWVWNNENYHIQKEENQAGESHISQGSQLGTYLAWKKKAKAT